jgi:hypothetical protein
MEINKNIIKQQERGMMLEVSREQGEISPSHLAPYVAHNFLKPRLVERSEINRVLSVGMAKMSDHLRLYKDPFEPC